ncbi:hypothetical protein PSU4_60870 [Pseudonocardia sulfidoxydans NBRC 16205]|uniref:Uncharacterized protein n=2 Tax=Pseudonocardia sulfidoxydans TaxID=54011 RepID=A0A511DSE1_9PSEU|nr:hypothetical protein PSU4_60870 [Pseudonocardia sulfidoxydans NBRC 16205]
MFAGARSAGVPGVDLVLGQLGQRGAAPVEPAQELDGDGDRLLGPQDRAGLDWPVLGVAAQIA